MLMYDAKVNLSQLELCKMYWPNKLMICSWNKFTYPFICLLIAYKESMNIKWFFKLIFEHIVWNFKKFDPSDLPNETLRKIVKINDEDETIELRKGR